MQESEFLAEELLRLLEDFAAPVQRAIRSAEPEASTRPELVAACAAVPRIILACEVQWQLIADAPARPMAATLAAKAHRSPRTAHTASSTASQAVGTAGATASDPALSASALDACARDDELLPCMSCCGSHAPLHAHMCPAEQEPRDYVFLAAALLALGERASGLWLVPHRPPNIVAGMADAFMSSSSVDDATVARYFRLNIADAIAESSADCERASAIVPARALHFRAFAGGLHSLAVMSRLQRWRDASEVSLLPAVRGDVNLFWWKAAAEDRDRLTQFVREVFRALYTSVAWLLASSDAAVMRQRVRAEVHLQVLRNAGMWKLSNELEGRVCAEEGAE